MTTAQVFGDVKYAKLVLSQNLPNLQTRIMATLYASNVTEASNREVKKVMSVSEEHEKVPVQQIQKGRDPQLSIEIGALQPEVIELITGGTFASAVGTIRYPYQVRIPANGRVTAFTDSQHILYGSAADTFQANYKNVYDNSPPQNITRQPWDDTAPGANAFKQNVNGELWFDPATFAGQLVTVIGVNSNLTFIDLSAVYLGLLRIDMSVGTSTNKLHLVEVPSCEVNPGSEINLGDAETQSFGVTMYPDLDTPFGYKWRVVNRRAGRGQAA